MTGISIKPNGTPNITGWVQGDIVASLAGLTVGTVLLDVSDQFDAQNLLTITRVGNDILAPENVVYGRFVSPVDGKTQRANGDDEFVIYDFMLGDHWHRTLYHVRQQTPTELRSVALA